MTKKREDNQSSSSGHHQIEERILENLVALQKIHADLAEKFNKLSENIGSLLGLFEMTARSFAQNPANQINEKDKEFLEKIDRLIDQNKTIAKGLMLMEERIRGRVVSVQRNDSYGEESQTPIVKPLPKF